MHAQWRCMASAGCMVRGCTPGPASQLQHLSTRPAAAAKRPSRASAPRSLATQPFEAATQAARTAPPAAAAPPQPTAAPPNILDAAAAERGGVARVVLKRGKARLFRDGHPMVYSGAVDRVVGRPPPVAGDAVLLADGSGVAIGWGAFNPESMFRVRVLQLLADAAAQPDLILDVPALLRARIFAAAALRRTLGLPSPQTSVYRLCNSEGDRLSGLVADVLADTIVVSSSSAFVERNRELVRQLLMEATGLDDVVWRPAAAMLREEGIEPDADDLAVKTDEAAEPVEVLEDGVRFMAAPHGQKTGFYADQRESRKLGRQLAAGKRVLDLCCYTGGFALNAALGGAASVTGVDSSVPAIELARRNAALNGISDEACGFEQADIMDFMKAAAAAGRTWDLIVLDPPKLAPNRKSLQRAAHRYRTLNAAAMRLLPPAGGLLMTCSCSGAMTQSGTFLPTLQAAATAAGKRVSVLRSAGAALDHPVDVSYPEGTYLTNILLSVV